MVLTPIFSFWTIGPAVGKLFNSSCCCYDKSKNNSVATLGVSFFYTFINVIITGFGCLFCFLISFSYIIGDLCSSFGGNGGSPQCAALIFGINIIPSLLLLGFTCVLLLKCFSESGPQDVAEAKCFGIPLVSVKNFDINEVKRKIEL